MPSKPKPILRDPAPDPKQSYEDMMIASYMEGAIHAAQRGDMARCEQWLGQLGGFLERHPEA